MFGKILNKPKFRVCCIVGSMILPQLLPTPCPPTSPQKRYLGNSVVTLIWKLWNSKIQVPKFHTVLHTGKLKRFVLLKSWWYSEVTMRTWEWVWDSWWLILISICIYCVKKKGMKVSHVNILICFVYLWNGLKFRFGSSAPFFLLCLELLQRKEIIFFRKQ